MNIAEHIAYLIGDSKRVLIPVYNDQYSQNGVSDRIEKDTLEQWIQDSIVKISRLMPARLKLHMNKSKSFTAGEWSENLSEGIGFDLNSLDSSDINSILRYDGEVAYEARMIPFSLRSKARFGSGFLDECSETDPIYYINEMRLMVEPKPEDTHLDALDGFCTIDYISYPKPDANDESLEDVPFDMHQIVLISTASKCKKFELDSLKSPDVPIIDPNFKVSSIDMPDVVDSIDRAKELMINYQNSFKEFLNDEDIEMAKTALSGSANELQIASLELSDKDKVAGQYLSEYAQNISNYAQSISKFSADFRKISSDYDRLEQEYEDLIYSLRGELPNKKQLKDTEKKLAQIRQVVQN